MPEGPEVRTISDVLRKKVLNRQIESIELSDNAKVFNFNLYEEHNIKHENPTITKIYSYGKKLIIILDDELAILFSLGMTGAFRYKKETHTHVIFNLVPLQDVTVSKTVTPLQAFNFTDTRRFGDVSFYNLEGLEEEINKLGPDLLEAALTTEITKKKWLEIFKRKSARGLAIGNKAICVILLDQNFVAGIGNYLKSEILYYSSILPDRLANDLSDFEWEKMRTVAHHIIKLSYAYGGLTIESYISPDGKMGKYPAAVYNKQKDPLGNKIIKGKTKDSRGSYWVDEIQK